MQPITFDRHSYLIDGKPVYLNSGEFHYFRVPRQDWRRRMELFKEAGGNCLATYIPWLIHESSEGLYDFGEHDYTDLEGFLKTAQEAGLYVAVRPGPYQYSELLFDGLPGWLCENYSEALAQDIGGRAFRASSISYIHPTFLSKAKRWFDQVCPILARYTLEKGGPIAFVQVDNELTGIHVWFGSLDYNPVSMGFGQADGRFPLFLQKRYGDIHNLNRQYGLQEASFATVSPVDMRGPATLEALRRRRDYYEFYLGTVAEYAATLAGWIREHGLQVPIIHNSGNPGMNAMFRETIARMGSGFLLGSDHYYNLNQTWEQNNPTPQYARKCFYSLEMLRLMGFPPTVFELPGGSCSDWPPVTPEDALACYQANAALGMKGHNYYIFTGGPNPPGAGATTDLYDYGASISPSGEVRPLYAVQKEFGTFMQARPWLAQAEREGDCRFSLDWELERAGDYWSGGAGFLLGSPQARDFLLRGPLSTALCASLSPVFIDLEQEDWAADSKSPLVVVCSSVMAASKQERLVRFLSKGGKALFTPILPEYDENFQACTVLKDFLGGGKLVSSGRSYTRLNIAGVQNVCNNGEAFLCEAVPTGAEMLGQDERSGKAVCWSQKLTGGGEAIFLGLRWEHTMNEQGVMLRSLLLRLGLQQIVFCSNPNLWTSLRTSGSQSVLYVLNLLSAPMEASIQCQPAWSEAMIDTGVHRLAGIAVKVLELK